MACSTDIDSSDMEDHQINSFRSRKQVSNNRSKSNRSKIRVQNRYGGSSSSSPDEPFTNKTEIPYKLPFFTSQWTLYDVESLRIHYCKESVPISNILDMVYDQTGMFAPLTLTQKDDVKSLQDQIMFSYSFSDLGNKDLHYHIVETKNGLNRDMHVENQLGKLNPSLAQDFVTSTVVMLVCYDKLKKSAGQLPQRIFSDLFMVFSKMCGLVPSAGEAWKTKFEVLQQKIVSVSDMVILADVCENHAVSIVSIVEDKNRPCSVKIPKMYKKTKPVRKTSDSNVCTESKSKACEDVPDLLAFSDSHDSDKFLHEEPAIYRSIVEDVLAKHAGDLLGHSYGYKFINRKNQNELHLGMIVVGTQVTFTLLEYNYEHMVELEGDIAEEGRSYIHYSEPKDMLKKEDRDQLCEAFVRLGNVNQESLDT